MIERGKITCYIAMSLDGYIAREDGNVDWLPAIRDEEDYGYYDFLSTVDGIVVGNSTYRQFLHGQAYPFGNRTCYVFSYEDEKSSGNVLYIKTPIAEFVDSFHERENEHLWLMGGATIIAGFMVADAIEICKRIVKQRERCFFLVDELIVTILPIVLGNGIPLFIPGIPESLWKLKGTSVRLSFSCLSSWDCSIEICKRIVKQRKRCFFLEIAKWIRKRHSYEE